MFGTQNKKNGIGTLQFKIIRHSYYYCECVFKLFCSDRSLYMILYSFITYNTTAV